MGYRRVRRPIVYSIKLETACIKLRTIFSLDYALYGLGLIGAAVMTMG